MTWTFVLKAIQLVEVKGEQLVVKEKAVEHLQQIANENGDKPVTVVSLIGKYRSGKSTLLNDLIGKKDAFCAGDGTDTVTKGVWCYIIRKQDKYIIYMDVQGNF